MTGMLTAPFYLETDAIQRKYEMLRAHFVDRVEVNEAVDRFGYSVPRFWQLWKVFKEDRMVGLLSQKKGPKRRWKVTRELREAIVRNRKAGMNIEENEEAMLASGFEISQNTVWKVLREEGFGKKPRGKTNGVEVTSKTHPKADIESLVGRSVQTKFAGLFFLVPYMRLLGIDDWGAREGPVASMDVPTLKTTLTILNLKSIGAKRFAHVTDYADDLGIAIATGMSRLVSKTTVHEWASSYTWDNLNGILKATAKNLIDLKILTGDLVNVDFHNIPYWGESEPLAKEYVPTRGKGLRAVKTIAVQDQNSTFPIWGTTRRADLSADRAVLAVADICDEFFGHKKRKLVFDCTTATYRALSKLNERGVLFTTLRRKCDELRSEIEATPRSRWNTVRLEIPKRKHQKLLCSESLVQLDGYHGKLRQIVVKGNGHEEPMVAITNDKKTPVKQCLEEYARRWREENNISENIDFFSLNRLPGYVELKADVNVTFTLIADQLYKLFARDVAGHDKCKPDTLFRKFIHKSGTVEVTSDEVIVSLTPFKGQELIAPVFRNMDRLLAQHGLAPQIPWLGRRRLTFRFI